MFKEGSFFKQKNKELVFYVLGPPKTKSYSIHTPTSIVMFPDVPSEEPFSYVARIPVFICAFADLKVFSNGLCTLVSIISVPRRLPYPLGIHLVEANALRLAVRASLPVFVHVSPNLSQGFTAQRGTNILPPTRDLQGHGQRIEWDCQLRAAQQKRRKAAVLSSTMQQVGVALS